MSVDHQPRGYLHVTTDVGPNNLSRLFHEAARIPQVKGIKIGAKNIADFGGETVVSMASIALGMRINNDSDRRLITVDGQKYGNDPETGVVKTLHEADQIIIFPFAGDPTAELWMNAIGDLKKGPTQNPVEVLVGGAMTVPGFYRNEGGIFTPKDSDKIYRHAARVGVRKFVVPGNRLRLVRRFKKVIESEIGSESFELYSTGFGERQGGDVVKFARAVEGVTWHVFMGSEITKDGPERYHENIEKNAALIDAINRKNGV